MIEGAVTSSRSCREDISNYNKREIYNENKRTNADLQQTKELFRNEVKLNNETERSRKSRDLQSNSFELKSQISTASQSRATHLVSTLSCLGIEVSERKTRVRRSQSNQVRSMESRVRRPKRVESEKSQRKHTDESKTPSSYDENRSKNSELMEDSIHNVETNNLKTARSISGPFESVKTPETIPHITQPSRMINNTSENEIVRNQSSKNRKLKRSKHSSRKEKSMPSADLISSKNNYKHTEKGKRCQQQQQQPFQNFKAVSTEPHKACEILDYTNYISAMLEDTTELNKNRLHLLQNTNLNDKNKIIDNLHEPADKHKTKTAQKLKRSSSVPSTYIYSDKYKCLTNKNSDIPNQTNLNHDVAILNKDDLPLNEDSKVQRKRKHITGKNTNLKRTSQTNLINEGNETMLPATNICPNKEQSEFYEEVDDAGCAFTIHELSGIKSSPCLMDTNEDTTEQTADSGEIAKHNLQCNANACVPSKMNICVNDKEEMLHKENITILDKIELQGEKVQQQSSPENIDMKANTELMTNGDGASDIHIFKVETENNSAHGQLLDYPATDHEQNCFADNSKLSSDMVNMENVTRSLVHVKQGNNLDNKLLRSQSLSIDDRKLQIKVRRQKTVVFPYDSSSKRILASKQGNVFPQKLLSKHHNKSPSNISTLDSNSLISSLEIPLYGSDSAEHHGIPHRSQTPNPTKQNFDSVGQLSDKSLVPSENDLQVLSKSGAHPDKWTHLQIQNLENPDICDHKARMLLFSREMNTDNTDASYYTIIESSSDEVDEESIENNSAVAAVSESSVPTKSVDLTRRSSFLIQTTLDNHRQVRRSKSERQTGRTQPLSKA